MTSGDDRAEVAAWLRLAATPGLSIPQALTLLHDIGPPEVIVGASLATLSKTVGVQAARALRALDPAGALHIETALAWSDRPAHFLLTLTDPLYPKALFALPDPPLVLYAQGDPGILSEQAIAVTGSQNATDQGLITAAQFAAAFSASGWTIVTGLATGTEAAVQQALTRRPRDTGSQTIAVLPFGLDQIYPASHLELARRIAARGVLVSEFPLASGTSRANRLRTARLIATLARAVLVTEASVRDESLATAHLAAEFGRDVFAIPGSIHAPLARGCHRLIKEGAKLVESASDVLELLR